MSPAKVKYVILACCALHNYMRTEARRIYTPPGYADVVDQNGDVIDGTWRMDAENEQPLPQNREFTSTAKAARDLMCDYFTSEAGRVDWQDRHVNRT